MSCDCISTVDAMLAERNTRIMLPIVLMSGHTPRPMIVTEQIETGRGKKKAVGMFATFCPFCGDRYDPAPAEPAASSPVGEGAQDQRAQS